MSTIASALPLGKPPAIARNSAAVQITFAGDGSLTCSAPNLPALFLALQSFSSGYLSQGNMPQAQLAGMANPAQVRKPLSAAHKAKVSAAMRAANAQRQAQRRAALAAQQPPATGQAPATGIAEAKPGRGRPRTTGQAAGAVA